MLKSIASDPFAQPILNASCIGPDTRILVVDDHEVNRKVFAALLGLFGGAPTVVNDGAQAVLAWELGDWDIILMDIQMPVMDGVTATRLIRAREQESGRARTPIIAVTCNTSTEDAASYRSAGMDALVPKPIEFAALIAAMNGAVRDAPAREGIERYRPIRLEPHSIGDAKVLAAYIAKELNRLGIARSKAHGAVSADMAHG